MRSSRPFPLFLVLRQRVKRSPDKPTHLSGDSGNGDIDVLTASKEIVEAFAESMLGLECDGDDLGWLALPAPVKDQVGAATVAVVPGGVVM